MGHHSIWTQWGCNEHGELVKTDFLSQILDKLTASYLYPLPEHGILSNRSTISPYCRDTNRMTPYRTEENCWNIFVVNFAFPRPSHVYPLRRPIALSLTRTIHHSFDRKWLILPQKIPFYSVRRFCSTVWIDVTRKVLIFPVKLAGKVEGERAQWIISPFTEDRTFSIYLNSPAVVIFMPKINSLHFSKINSVYCLISFLTHFYTTAPLTLTRQW